MTEKKEKVMRVNIDPGNVFYSDFIVISHNPKKFIIDFQQTTPRFNKISEEELHQAIVLKHNTVLLEPEVAKDFLTILTENLKKYEKSFGKIKVQKKKAKKPVKKSKKESVSYIG